MERRQRGRGGRNKGLPRDWTKMSQGQEKRPRLDLPPGLTGRQIGMYYKNVQKNKPKQERMMEFHIPEGVISGLRSNVTKLDTFAKGNNIYIKSASITKYVRPTDTNEGSIDEIGTNIKKETPSIYVETRHGDDDKTTDKNKTVTECNTSHSTEKKETEETINKDMGELQVNLNKTPTKDNNTASDQSPQASGTNRSSDTYVASNHIIKKEIDEDLFVMPSTTTVDFYPVKREVTMDYGAEHRVTSLRSSNNYKYGYDDIITFSYEEKLAECLSKGIPINTVSRESERISTTIYEEYKNMIEKDGYKQILKFRKLLPTYKKGAELIDVIDKNQTVVISGETGCGKSTQLPQLILDEAICKNKGANVKILVTQPRRIAASSLAMRVAKERAEKLGITVGYAVRLETVEPRSVGSIIYCTTGILLAELEANQGLTGYSHIILDEVHERDSHVDLAMCVLKRLLTKRKDLKLILMSATIDSETLSMYFDDCPVVTIEGLAYPVKDVYLEDILKMTHFQLPLNNPPHQNRHRRRGRKNNDMEKEIQYKYEISSWIDPLKKTLDRHVYETLLNYRIEDMNLGLIHELICYICKGPPGAILVFLPGIGEITNLMKKLPEDRFPKSTYLIYPLHSKLPTLQQHQIFERPPDGVRKIIIATNIAETSITIDDIVYVIDCGKIKYSGLNVEEKVVTLKSEWIAKANLQQRRGRAGRCQPGICYHTITSFRAEKLQDRLLPELQRSNLLEPVLVIKKLRLGKALDALNFVPSLPDTSIVEWAVKHLQQCGALDTNETLTPLGWHLARLPVHPSAGKLLILGVLFGCLDRAATVAAVWGFKDPFILVLEKGAEIKRVKQRLCQGEPSDHVVISEAVIQWESFPNGQAKRKFAYNNFLSYPTLELLSEMKKQLGDSLRQMGFMASGNVKSSWENRNTKNLSLFKAIIAGALYPNIGSCKWLRRRGIIAKTSEHPGVKVHPGSVLVTSRYDCFEFNTYDACWLVYWLKQKSAEIYLIEVTTVSSTALLFFGELTVTDEPEHPNACILTVSSIKLRCERETAQLILRLRGHLDNVLAARVGVNSEYATRDNQYENQVFNAVIDLITAEDIRSQSMAESSESDITDTETDAPLS